MNNPIISEIKFIDNVHSIDESNDNIDIQVNLKNGESYTATFFTLSNIQKIIDSYKETGECFKGTYFFAKNMIIVNRITQDNITHSVNDLLKSGEFYDVFHKIE